MKKLLYISLLAVLLSAAMSCSRSVDKRLVLADTLMWTNPDSSLAILSAIKRDSLQGEENLAYHSLLLTQAQFRCYGNCSSDSLINFALDYYSDNHNREHHTRSLLYKGSFYEVHDNPIEAIKWYKQAEDNADSTDYSNLAQINMRMAVLYYENYASNNIDLEKFKRALFFYDKLHDKRMTALCHSYLGNLYRINDQQKAQEHFSIAIEQTKEIGDSSEMFVAMSSLSLSYYMDGDYNKAKNTALYCIKNGGKYIDDHCYYNLARAYCALGDVDSAKFYLSKTQRNPNDKQMLVIRYLTLKEIAESSGDNLVIKKYETLYNNLYDSLSYNPIKYSLFENERNIDEEITARDNNKISLQHKTIYGLIALFLVFALITTSLFIVISRKNRKDKQQMIDELKEESFGNYEELRSNLADIDNHFSKTMTEKLTSLEEIMTGAYNPTQDSKSSEVVHKISPIADDDTKFWEGLYSYINIKHNGAMDRIANDYPQLSASDLNFIKLMCCGFSDAAIAVCRNYRNVASVRSRRRKIRDKMGIKGNLTDYVINITQGLDSNNSLQH